MLSRLKNVCDNAVALIIPSQACAAQDTWVPNPVGHISIFGRHFSEPLNVPCVCKQGGHRCIPALARA